MEARDLTVMTDINKTLAEILTVPEAKDWVNKADALQDYAKKSGATLEGQNHYAELGVRFRRKEGELLIQLKEDGKLKQGGDKKSKSPETTLILSDMNISRDESSQAQTLAKMPVEKFEETICLTAPFHSSYNNL